MDFEEDTDLTFEEEEPREASGMMQGDALSSPMRSVALDAMMPEVMRLYGNVQAREQSMKVRRCQLQPDTCANPLTPGS